MAKEFIIRSSADMNAVIALVKPVIAAKKPFRLTLHRGLKRTIDQNKLLHGIFEECANKTINTRHAGMDATWFKNELKCKLGLKEVHFDIHDQPTVIIKSTSEYTTKELSDFCEKIVAYMKVEYGVDIELPDDLKGSK